MPDLGLRAIPIRIALPARSEETSGLAEDSVAREAARQVRAVLRSLRVPVEPAITVRCDGQSPRMEMTVDGVPCRYPDELAARLRDYFREESPKPGGCEQADTIDSAEEFPPEGWGRLAALAIARQPGILIGAEPGRNGDVRPAGEAEFEDALRTILDLRLALPDEAVVRAAMSMPAERRAEALEDLIAEAAAEAVEVRLSPLLMEEVWAGEEDWDASIGAYVQEQLFEELGLLCPRVRAVADEELMGRSLCVRLNDLCGPPFRAFGPDRILVNDAPERLGLLTGGAGDPFPMPGSAAPASLASASHAEALRMAGLTVWTQKEQLALVTAVEIRENAALLVNAKSMGILFSTIGDSFPALWETVQRRYTVAALAKIVRALVTRQVPVRDLVLLLERVADLPYVTDPVARFTFLDDRMPVLDGPWNDGEEAQLQAIAAGLARQIGAARSRNTDTVVAYLIDVDAEKALDEGSSVAAGELLLAAVERELTHLPNTAATPCLLVRDCHAGRARQLLRHRFPRMAVAGFSELPANLNVQPVARIGINQDAAGRGPS